jgi:hypothetical protein
MIISRLVASTQSQKQTVSVRTATRPRKRLTPHGLRCAAVLLAIVGVNTALPVSAHAYSTIAPAPIAGPPGLPDGRVYEQVSPANKHGNAAAPPIDSEPPAMLAEPGGDGVAYSVSGTSIGSSQSGEQSFTVAKRTAGGWVNNGATPRSLGEQCLLCDRPGELGFSEDLSQVFFSSQAKYIPGVGQASPLLYNIATGSLAWLDPPPASSNEPQLPIGGMAGFSSDMSTFYFSTQFEPVPGSLRRFGFFEWHNGVVSVAGVLPDGTVDPHALPAGLPAEAGGFVTLNAMNNQVSADGTRAFFVSSLGGTGAPELYVRVRAENGAESTVLVSRDTLSGPVSGLPAPAPDGVVKIAFQSNEGYIYASPDGERAFFVSSDQLTSAAPSGGGMYEFSTLTDSLTYLPEVGDSPILVSSQDGSRFIFNSARGLSLWSESEGGGSVTPIEPFAVGGEARTTPDGSVFAFESAAPIAGFNNGGSHLTTEGAGPFRNQEIYRYDVSENSLTCASCPPAGIVPSGNAYLSHQEPSPATDVNQSVLMRASGLSVDGSRVFFDTPDPLVPQDTNTAPPTSPPDSFELAEHGRDVYEWENGSVFLISSGTSSGDSYVGDESADGNDVFFSTAQGLSPADTDEGYDVYDARVPRPGDRAPTPAAPCAGDVCQGPPSVPVLLGAPASATFSGLGNATSEPAAAPAAKPKVKAKATKCKKGFIKKKNKCVKAKPKKQAKKSSNKRRGN